jgi:lipopolysaccharide biosynthesis regulator YciM
MADELDLASDREQIARDKAVQVIQNKPLAATATGFCLECGEPVAEGVRWCCPECRDDWERWNPEA